ncbi:hypothetical protein ACFQ0G_05385 [Streptomyces chiangmaiensis]
MDHVQVCTRELITGRYRALKAVHDEHGRSVWIGEDEAFGRPVTLTGSRIAPVQPEVTVRRTVARILRESEAIELLCPGRVATVLDVVEDSGVLWTVTERIDGTPLGAVLAHGPLNYVRAARIGLGILDVLEAAHRRGATHGDLSPGQVFVQEGGTVVVTGFGLIGASVTQRVTAPSYASPSRPEGRVRDRRRTSGRWERCCTRWWRAVRRSGTGARSSRHCARSTGSRRAPR